ncbi:MAG TPA: FkbM family methyltransferase [Acidimicrobiales bacterium]|nr:FkbM family methyltransferase [Acidimicrobiales bacterium]
MFVSYAQNAEDVVLARAFAGRTTGLYVDVGAAHPVDHSVTKHFYDLGWRGVNVEPHTGFFELLELHRPGDVNVHAGVAAEPGRLTFFVGPVHHPGGSTFDPDVAGRLEESGLAMRSVDAEVTTLAAVLEAHVGDRAVDFLKVDVEGRELEVLEGADWSRWRPTVVLVEAIDPVTRERSDKAWAHVLTGAGYRAVLFDGVNLFFAQEDDVETAERLAAPANFCDDFVPAAVVEQESNFALELWRARDRSALLEHQVAVLRAELAERDERLGRLSGELGELARRLPAAEAEAGAARAELAAVRATRWWRLGRLPRLARRLIP